jgi:Ca2+-transporting ATPase
LLEVVVHPTSSLVFEADAAEPDVMLRPPRSRTEGLFSGRDWMRPLLVGGTLSAGVLGLYVVMLRVGVAPDAARAAAFVTMIVGQVLTVLVVRSPARPLWHGLRGNVALLVTLPLTLALLPVAIFVPAVSAALHFTQISPAAWATALLTAGATTLWYEPLKPPRREARYSES